MVLTRSLRLTGFSVLTLAAAVSIGGASGALGDCGPFTDVTADVFCPFVLEIFTLGITTGTTATTFDPASDVSRVQMAAFLSRTVDGVLQRGSRRIAMKRFWTPQNIQALSMATVSAAPLKVQSDGTSVWVSLANGSVSRVRASDGSVLRTWTGADFPQDLLLAMGRVIVTSNEIGGKLYQIDPTQPGGSATTVVSALGGASYGIAFDGARVWTANSASISIVTPGAVIPWTVTTVAAGFQGPSGILFDGANVWVSDATAGKLFKLDSNGAILQTITVGSAPETAVYDGANIWVPNFGSNSISVVRSPGGSVLATLTGNGLNFPDVAAFDGRRILVTNFTGNSVSLWKAADLTTIGSFPMPASSAPYGACSDGVTFWVALSSTVNLARF